MTDALRKAALAARNNAYTPYSNFPVGAAVEMEDGAIFGGGNIENAAYPQSICAERSAVAGAVSAGHRNLRRIYVVADPMSTPCGGCRSVLAEFGTPDTEVILGDLDGQERRTRLGDLIPYSFEMQDGLPPAEGEPSSP